MNIDNTRYENGIEKESICVDQRMDDSNVSIDSVHLRLVATRITVFCFISSTLFYAKLHCFCFRKKTNITINLKAAFVRACRMIFNHLF